MKNKAELISINRNHNSFGGYVARLYISGYGYFESQIFSGYTIKEMVAKLRRAGVTCPHDKCKIAG